MKIPVFVSAPTVLTNDQEASRKLILRELDRNGLEARALGRSDYPTELPLREVLTIARHCAGGIILGFAQFGPIRALRSRVRRTRHVATSARLSLRAHPTASAFDVLVMASALRMRRRAMQRPGVAEQEVVARIGRGHSGNPTFLRSALTRGSPRSKANSGNVRILPIRTGPCAARRSRAAKVRSLSPNPAKTRA